MHGVLSGTVTVSDMLASHHGPAHDDCPGGGLGIQSGSTNHAIRSPLEHQLLSTLSIYPSRLMVSRSESQAFYIHALTESTRSLVGVMTRLLIMPSVWRAVFEFTHICRMRC